jgi:hypothetical protein
MLIPVEIQLNKLRKKETHLLEAINRKDVVMIEFLDFSKSVLHISLLSLSMRLIAFQREFPNSEA